MSEQSAADQARSKCECEHAVHFDSGEEQHTYQGVLAVSQVKTPYGTFEMCRQCISERHFATAGGDRDA